jgi:hypothetical protein
VFNGSLTLCQKKRNTTKFGIGQKFCEYSIMLLMTKCKHVCTPLTLRQRIRHTLSGTPICGAARPTPGPLRMASIIRSMMPCTFSDETSPGATSCAVSCRTGSPAFTVPGVTVIAVVAPPPLPPSRPASQPPPPAFVLTLLHCLPLTALAATAEWVSGAAGVRWRVAAAADSGQKSATILLKRRLVCWMDGVGQLTWQMGPAGKCSGRRRLTKHRPMIFFHLANGGPTYQINLSFEDLPF